MSGRRTVGTVVVLSVAGALVATPSAAEPGWISEVSTLTSRLSAGQYEVVLAPDGTAFAAWVEEGAGTFLLMSSRRPPGRSWAAPVQVDTGSPTQDAEPSIAVDGQGHVVAAWRDYLPGRTGSVIRAATYDGSSWSASRDLSPATTHAFEPDVATNAGGDAAVVWTQDVGAGERIVGAAYRATEKEPWAAADLTTTPGAVGASVAVDADGRATALWRQAGSVLTADRTPAAGAWSATRVLSTNPSQELQVIVDASGRTTAAWANADISGTSGIEVATRPPGGEWDATTTLAASSAGLIWQLDLGVDVTGEAVAAWAASSDGNRRSDLYTATRSPGGGWTVTRVRTPQVYNSSPTVGFGTGRSSVILWTGSPEQLTSSYTLYAITRTEGHDWSQPTSLASGAVSGPRVAVDPAGHGTLLWTESGAVLRSQVFDGVAPTIEELDTTTFARPGQAASYSAKASDLWSAPSVTWKFDDRAPVVGRRVTRSFAAPGVHRVLVVATDEASNRTARRSYTIVASRRPRLSGVSLSKQVIRLAGPKAARRTQLSFHVAAPARVRVSLIDRSGATVATVTRAMEPGRRTLVLTGARLDVGRGRYAVRVTARNVVGTTAAGHVSLRVRR